jgi:hypothetical protein
MARQLPRLDKAINYMMTDPLRWSEEHGLVKRAYTIDTWDFKLYGTEERDWKDGNEVQEYVFNIHPDTPMCIMHGDNSGLYQACRQMAIMHRALGHDARADDYDGRAESIRANLNRLAWNGRYYDHWVPIDPLEVDQGGVDGTKVLSLSNPYDINRGLPDHEQAAAIIRQYIRLREELKDTHFAEWVSVYPYWPNGFHSLGPGEYVNGGIILIVAGELAKAAFHHGFEAYGADIVERVHGLMESYRPGESDGRRERGSPVPCSYEPSGKVSYGIPDGWAHGAVMSAIMEGLCGVRDVSTAFGHARIEPRWVAAGVTEAAATARYGASDGYVSYRFEHDTEARRIAVVATGSGSRFDYHVLLPAGAEPARVTVNGEEIAYQTSVVEQSGYVDFTLERAGVASVVVDYVSR